MSEKRPLPPPDPEARIRELERSLAEAHALNERLKAAVAGLRDERDRAVYEKNTAEAKLGAARRQIARTPADRLLLD